jgi:peptidoglycan hydrolase-like protein with peptidoglycan-binding domain
MNPKTFRRIIIGVVLVILVLFGVVFVMSAVRQEPVTQFVSRGASLFPFGPRTTNTNVQTTEQGEGQTPTQEQPTFTTEEPAQVLQRITDKPVTGFVAFDTFEEIVRDIEVEEGVFETEILELLVPRVRYNERATGHIYETQMRNELLEEQITQTDIPGAQEVFFDTTGENVALRFFNNNNRAIETFVATIPEKPEPPNNLCQLVFTEELALGSTGLEVVELQKFLSYELGRDLGTDGSFGRGTQTALVEFQQSRSLLETGIMDQTTRDAANIRCRIALQDIALQAESPVDLEGGFFSENLTAFANGPAENQFLYMFEQNDTAFAITSNTAGTTRRQVFDSSFTDWLPQWVNGSTVALTTRASAFAPGFLYHLNISNGELRRVIGDLEGLTTLTSPNGTRVITSESRNGNLQTSVYEVDSGVMRSLGLATLAEKCVWRADSMGAYCAVPTFLPIGDYPDDWYKGKLRLTDSIWYINTETSETELLASPLALTGQGIDVTLPALNPSESHLFFVDQNTNELWSLAL